MPWRFRTTGIDVLELVGDLLGVVEALGDDEVHAHVAAAVAAAARARSAAPPSAARGRRRRRRCRRTRRAGAACPGGGRSGARDSGPRARPRARRARPRRVRVALLGEAEVDERAVPGIAERHIYSGRLALSGDFPATYVYRARADSHDRRALLGGDREVLASCPSTARADRARRRAPRSAANQRRLSSGRSVSGGIVISPDHGHRAALQEAVESSGRTPLLPSSRATLTSTSTSVSASPCLPSSRAPSRWPPSGSSARAAGYADLAALQVADEVPREASAVAAALPRGPERGSRRRA